MKTVSTFLLICAVFSVYAEKTADLLRQKALKGDVYAMIRLGDEFFRGQNRPRNPDLAAFWYRKAALTGLPLGMYKYGVCHEFGWGVKQDLRKAYEYYKTAGKLGAAKLRQAELLLRGVPGNGELPAVAADKVNAIRIMRKLCREHYYPALMKLAGILYADPQWRKKHGKEIYSLTLQSSNTDTVPPEVMVFHAKLLQQGIGTKADPVYARALLEIAARSGDPEGMFRFAQALEAGIGTPVNRQKAFEYFQKAAALKHAGAMTRIGDFYLSGTFLAHDPPEAFKQFTLAAGKKYPAALRKVGWCYENGIGIAKDLLKAFSFYERSAAAGDAEGTYHLGRCFLEGIGVKADPVGAVFYFRRSASMGNRDAMFAFAECLSTGRGCAPDPALAERIRSAAAKL